MSKKGINYYLIFVIAFLLMFNKSISTYLPNKVKINKTNYEVLNNSPKADEIIYDFNDEFELNKVIIKENDNYEITSFIPENINLKNVDYNYKYEYMGNYKDIGNYEIVIVFKDFNGRTIEKTTTLKIETKVDLLKTITNGVKIGTIESKVLKDNKKLGTYGRLYFESLYSIALYHPITSEEAQQIVDDNDSGAYYKYYNIMIIADHAYQGFSIIKSQNIGNYVYIKNLSDNGEITLEKYIVREKTTGINTGPELITDDNKDIGKDFNNDLALYTCNSKDGYKITILLLDKVN